MRVPERLRLSRNLNLAIEAGELELFYQPKHDPSTNLIVGFEALSRWNHKGIYVSPDDFIPIAERSGAIVPLGAWALKTACVQMKTWVNQGYSNINMAVNISNEQFQQVDVFALVKQTLDSTGLESKHLELELTERCFIKDSDTITTLNKIRDTGVKISIDDFGTGYSCLAYLQDIPADKLKIDKSFIDDTDPIKKNELTSSIIGVAKKVGLKIVAEGVERQPQLDFLRKHGCDEVQGWFYNKAENAIIATGLLKSQFES